MLASEILELVRAGYTKAEIDSFSADAVADQASGTAETETQTTAPAPDPIPAPVSMANNDRVLEAISALTQAIQASNIVKSTQPGQPAGMTAEDVIGAIIRPKRREKEV